MGRQTDFPVIGKKFILHSKEHTNKYSKHNAYKDVYRNGSTRNHSCL